MKREFKEGDRVAVYHRHQRIVGVVDSVRDTGELRVIEDGFYAVHEESPFHSKQCRRLKIKNPRREWVLSLRPDGTVVGVGQKTPGLAVMHHHLGTFCLDNDRVTVREVRKAVNK